jgi:hypothetical protein
MSPETPDELPDESYDDFTIFIEELCGSFIVLWENVDNAIQKIDEAIARIHEEL